MVRGPHLAVLAERGLEVVGQDGQVVGVAGGVRLLKGRQLTGRVRAAVEHVVALPHRTAADLGEPQGTHVGGLDPGPPVVGHRHAAAQLAGGPWEAVRRNRFGAAHGRGPQVGADALVVALMGEEEVLAAGVGPAAVRLRPERLRIAAEQRKQFLTRELDPAPGGRRPQRRAQSGFLSQALQRAQMAGLVVELVLDLDRDDRAAVRPVQAAQLPGDLREPGAHGLQIRRIVGARRAGAGEQPVGQAAVAHLGVAPGADARDEVQAVPGAQLGEATQVAVAVEADPSLDLLVVDPDDVGRDGGHPARLHLQQLLLPLPGRVAGVVELAGDREPGAAAPGEPAAGDPDRVGYARSVREGQVAGQRGSGGLGNAQPVRGHHVFSGPRSGVSVSWALVAVVPCSSSRTSSLPPGRSTGAGTYSVCCGPRFQ
ncbi:hypothetical protein SVIOM74S_00500 [Streptomyces violarus]